MAAKRKPAGLVERTAPDYPRGWAVRRADGRIVVDCDPKITEASIWRIALGWPDADEIADEKRRGGRAFRVVLLPMDEWGEPMREGF